MNSRAGHDGAEGKGRLSYWLVPAEPDKADFAQIISELAERLESPAFEPHVTLYSGPRDMRDNPEQIIRTATRHFSEILLRTSGVGGSQEFTRTLFVEFCPSEPLLTLGEQLRRGSAQPEPYALRPHLSLIYAQLDGRLRQELAGKISVPPVVRFDAVKAIVSRERTQSGEDVRAWRVIAEVPLVVH